MSFNNLPCVVKMRVFLPQMQMVERVLPVMSAKASHSPVCPQSGRKLQWKCSKCAQIHVHKDTCTQNAYIPTHSSSLAMQAPINV